MENSKSGTLIIVRHPTVAPLGFEHVGALQAALPSLSATDRLRVEQNQIYQRYMKDPVVQKALATDPKKKVIENALFPFVDDVQILRLATMLNSLNAANPLSSFTDSTNPLFLFMDHGNFKNASGKHMVDFIDDLLPLLNPEKQREDIHDVKTGFYENPETAADISAILDLLLEGKHVATLARFEGLDRIARAFMEVANSWQHLLSPVQDRKTSPLPQGGAFVIPTYTDNGLVLPNVDESYILNTTPAYRADKVLPSIQTNGCLQVWTPEEAVRNLLQEEPQIKYARDFLNLDLVH